MTPEEAWKHVKALWPDSTHMTKFVMENNFSITSIDWPEGVDRWPPPEPQYREPRMPEDWGKEFEVRDYPGQWYTAKLAGVADEKHCNPRFFTQDGVTWRYARIRVDEK